MTVILAYAVAAVAPLATLLVGSWTIRRHDRIYPSTQRLDGRRSHRRFDAGSWLWRNGS